MHGWHNVAFHSRLDVSEGKSGEVDGYSWKEKPLEGFAGLGAELTGEGAWKLKEGPEEANCEEGMGAKSTDEEEAEKEENENGIGEEEGDSEEKAGEEPKAG